MFIYYNIDQTNNDSKIILNGTYVDAERNASVDYLALNIPITSLTMKCR
jgi:hypothetical protein